MQIAGLEVEGGERDAEDNPVGKRTLERCGPLGRFDFPPGIEGIKHVEDHPRPEKVPLPGLRFQPVFFQQKMVRDIEEKTEHKKQYHFELIIVVGLEFIALEGQLHKQSKFVSRLSG